jgi:hypothetical protein
VLGAGGIVVEFPKYFGNNFHKGNLDYCMKDPGMGQKHGGKKGGGKKGKGD